jgi:hypothetical protein
MLAIREGELIPKIIDFGLVKDVEGVSAVKTRTGMTMGTPAYMAPEQVRDAKNIDKRADIFALGAILYELVTGRRAFVGGDTFEIFRSIADGNYIDPVELVPDLPEHYATTIRTALQTDPAARFPDCEALLSSWSMGCPPICHDPANLWDTKLLQDIHAREQQRSADEIRDQSSEDTFALDDGEQISSLETLADETWSEPTGEVDSETCLEKAAGTDRVTLKKAAANFALGVLFSVPFVLGVLTLLFGNFIDGFMMGGPFMVLIGLLTTITFGVSMVIKCSPRDFLGGWVVMPTVVLVVGTLGTIAGIAQMESVVHSMMSGEGGDGADLRWVTEVPKLAALGVQNALTTALAGFALSGLAFLTAAIILASRAPGDWVLAFTRRRQMIAVTALGLGSMFWMVAPMIRDYPTSGPEGLFLVFLSLCVLGLAAARVSEGDPKDLDLWRARWGVLLCGVLGVSICVETESIAATRSIFEALGAEGSPIERVNKAKEFVEIIQNITGFNALGWMVIALGLALIPMWGQGGLRCPIPWRRWVLPGGLILIRLVATLVAFVYLDRAAYLVVPGQEAAAVHELFGFVAYDLNKAHHSANAKNGIVVEHVIDDLAIKAGDLIVAVNDRPVASVTELVEQVDACWCDETANAAAGCEFQWKEGEGHCLTPTCTVWMTLSRPDEAGIPRLVTESVDLQGG